MISIHGGESTLNLLEDGPDEPESQLALGRFTHPLFFTKDNEISVLSIKCVGLSNSNHFHIKKGLLLLGFVPVFFTLTEGVLITIFFKKAIFIIL